MIHLGLFLFAALIVLGFVGATFTVIAAAFEASPILGILTLFGAVALWIVLLVVVL